MAEETSSVGKDAKGYQRGETFPCFPGTALKLVASLLIQQQLAFSVWVGPV